MKPIATAEKIEISQGALYFCEYTEDHTEGYLELRPHTSLEIHNRPKGLESLTQVEGECVMILFDSDRGTNHYLRPDDKLRIEPEGAWHIHVNPFDETSLTHFYFEGNIKSIVEKIVSDGVAH